MPDEHRAWFEERGFKGDMNIDKFCVRLERAHHEAIHGGGNRKLGRYDIPMNFTSVRGR